MNEWIILDPDEFDEVTCTNILGVSTVMRSSPYHIPDAVRINHHDDLGYFGIEFLYINNEPLKRCRIADIVFKLGKNSKRIYEIELLNPIPDHQRASGMIFDAMSKLPESDNRRIIAELIEACL